MHNDEIQLIDALCAIETCVTVDDRRAALEKYYAVRETFLTHERERWLLATKKVGSFTGFDTGRQTVNAL